MINPFGEHCLFIFEDKEIPANFSSDIAIDKNYAYFALGNPYIMSIVHDAAKPVVAFLKHPIYKDGIRSISTILFL
jgi:hypothetical protein